MTTIALITGANKGIGLETARLLGARGMTVLLGCRDEERGRAAEADLRAGGADAHAIGLDVTDEDGVRAAAKRIDDTYGRLDVLVNNAGVGIGEAMEGITTKYLDMQLGVNLRAVVIGTREGLPMLREAGAEHGKALIVNLASIAGKVGQAWLSVYSATKAGVIGFSQATQKEVAGQGIQVTSLCPAFVDTPMTEFAKEQVNADEMIRPQDIAFIRPNQDAVVKLSAYDSSVYGSLKGKVERISADTIVDEKADKAERQETFYRVMVRTDKNHLGTAKNSLPIIPGMVATVEILTGEKSVLDYLLKPARSLREEALRER